MPATTRRAPLIIGLAASFAMALGACSAAGPSAVAPPGDASRIIAPGSSEASPDAWLVVRRLGEEGLRVVLASTGEQLYALPVGVPGETWRHVVTTAQTGKATEVNEIVVQPDLPTWRSRSVDGAWRLPMLGTDPLPVGVSTDGSTIVLVEDGAHADSTTTRFAVLSRNEAARILELSGAFEYDALSPDGSILYVVEHLPGPPDGHYQVRAVDVATGVLREAVIVDKRNLNESMGGWPITQARHPNGVVFTLYRGAAHPFIHALNSTEAWAVCLDLPMIGMDDAEAALDWGLARGPDVGPVFAVNATLGLAVEVDPNELSIRQAAAFAPPTAAARITLAKFGHQEGGPVGRRVVLSTDGSMLFAAGEGGIVQLETERLAATGTLLEGVSVGALALTPDGATIYALLHDDGHIVKVDVVSGEIVGGVPGDGFDRLVAIVPW